MRLTDQLNLIGRLLRIAGATAIACGLIFFVYDSVNQGFGLGQIGTVALLAAIFSGGIYWYQRTFQWRKMQRALMAAKLVEAPPAQPIRPLPAWLWAAWTAFALIMAFSINGPLVIFFGSLLLGYGLSSPTLARNVQALAAGRVDFYATRHPETRRPIIVRVLTED